MKKVLVKLTKRAFAWGIPVYVIARILDVNEIQALYLGLSAIIWALIIA